MKGARWWRFNLVGILGATVQLVALMIFNRIFHGHYLLACTVALELTLLHNFVWHRRYTWRERTELQSHRGQLLRFHLSNGLVSLIGNLALMRVLVHRAHLWPVAANAIAILSCSVLNFCLGDRWVFRYRDRTEIAHSNRKIAREVLTNRWMA
jgi:putative flippase GtrA